MDDLGDRPLLTITRQELAPRQLAVVQGVAPRLRRRAPTTPGCVTLVDADVHGRVGDMMRQERDRRPADDVSRVRDARHRDGLPVERTAEPMSTETGRRGRATTPASRRASRRRSAAVVTMPWCARRLRRSPTCGMRTSTSSPATGCAASATPTGSAVLEAAAELLGQLVDTSARCVQTSAGDAVDDEMHLAAAAAPTTCSAVATAAWSTRGRRGRRARRRVRPAPRARRRRSRRRCARPLVRRRPRASRLVGGRRSQRSTTGARAARQQGGRAEPPGRGACTRHADLQSVGRVCGSHGRGFRTGGASER